MNKSGSDYFERMLITIKFRILSFCLLSQNIRIKLHYIFYLPVILCGYENWCRNIKGLWEQGAEENIVTEEGGSNSRLGKIA